MPKKQKKGLTPAFEELRSLGYFAMQNFCCCQTCGWNAITDEQAKKAVFYHGQDAEDLRKKGECYVSWDGNGEEIISVFNKHGIQTEWNGNKETRIKIVK